MSPKPEKKRAMTIFDAYNDTKSKLRAAGIEDFVFEAKQIIKYVTGYTNKEILLNYTEALTGFQSDCLNAVVNERLTRYPLQYILGFWDFYGRRFKVGPGVLIPRQDTETVIEVCLELLKDAKDPHVLDLCAGTGCIGITLAAEKEDSSVTLIEKYEEAADYLAENLKQNAPENAKLIIGDVFEKCAAEEKYDLIVSNPPYIKSGDIVKLQPEVKHEPFSALDGGEDGLLFYGFIAKEYKDSLNPGGSIVFEIGFDEAQA
ncbi:MAG: peptide chain release factor N(5)-glutamine methyltransferase, partial [Clostridia bacterium]|nr:peptide chain release factor N(5)-glutamine methyltransferase [Clostridia bacterium]